MRSPIYNDRGQFRFSDFVAYIPEYLKNEPDVVTLLQVFSDYINNAYRNIETVEKFEFAIVTTSGNVDIAIKRMEYLRTMLDLAGARGDYVNFMSVPRANVKSNAVFGQDTGFSPYTINYNGSEIADRIDNASSVDPGIVWFNDGDVVFVNYDNIAGESSHVVAYYYDAQTNALVKDPEGTSQDPFTDTDNSASRVLSFKTSDVSTVKTRYGYSDEYGNQYKEVFFTARIFDVKSDNAVKEITLSGGQKAVIDYYGMERTQSGKMRTAIRFDGENGWKWKDGFPTAIIYLSETSGGNLAVIKGLDKYCMPANACTDPSYIETANRYAIVGIPVEEDNVLTVELDTCYPEYTNGTVYLAVKRNSQILGEFNVVKDSRESGRLDLRLIPTGTMPDISGYGDGELVLIDLPLFYGRGVLDYTQASPIIKLGMVETLEYKDEDGLNIIPDAKMTAYACTAEGNPEIGYLNIVKKDDPARSSDDSYMDGGYVIVVPFNSDIARNFGTAFDLGDRIYIESGNKYWDGLAIVKSFTAVADGYAMKLEGISAPIRPIRTATPATVRATTVGYFSVESDVITSGYFNESKLSEDSSVVVLHGTDNQLVARMSADGTFSIHVPDDTYSMEILTKTDARVRNLLQVDVADGVTTTIWSRSRGDLFTRPYVMLTDEIGNMGIGKVVYSVGEEVYPLVMGEYKKGQYVYDAATKRVYRCTEDCVVTDPNVASSSNLFGEDRIVHYSVPYAEKFNVFMPYYGPFTSLEYEGTVEYTTDPEVFMAPLYITKVEEKSLKYGWEHREFLNYGDSLNMSGKSRNGMVEFHTTERSGSGECLTADDAMDIVSSDLFDRCAWSYTHPIVTKGCSSSFKVDVDDPVSIGAERIDDDGTWKVTIHSAAHGLVDGAMVTVAGLNEAQVRGYSIDFNTALVPVDVVDGDTFTYNIKADAKIKATNCFALREHDAADIEYVQDYFVEIAAISADAGEGLSILFKDRVHGPIAGDMVYLDGCELNGAPFPAGPYEVASVNSAFNGITVRYSNPDIPVPVDGAKVRKPIAVGDIVVITDEGGKPIKFYEVESGIWPEVERNALVTPFDLFSQTNLFDVTDTNPTIALGDPIKVRDIIYTGEGRATVHLAEPLVHFTAENRKYIEGKTVVLLENITPSDFNGYHVVEAINSPTSIEISMRLYNTYTNVGIPTGDLEMTLSECRWYKFTVDEVEWEKTSSQATFTGKNTTNRVAYDNGVETLLCEYEHGLAVGDYVVLGTAFDRFDETTGLSDYAMGKVVSVPDKMNVGVKIVFGNYVPGMSINRGVITLPGSDNIVKRYGEYFMRLDSIGGEKYQFRNGDIVIAAGQLVPSERMSYLVREGSRWSILKKKRIVKIRKISVDEYRNSYFMDADADEDVDEYKYTTYSDVDVAKSTQWAYASRMYMVRNPIFAKPAIDNMDTTRDPNAEYSSAEDYANVAPRDDMKRSFKGVPDMKYPLIEKIERLAYLRDANVIDFELIGYLARFMGYDLTPMAEDVQTSNLYRTVKQQEAAIREAVLNLPQYYALGGTNAGLKMLMGAFGVIGEVLTLYTNTMHPYDEMLNRVEVENRLRDDTTNRTLEGTWVSTPYIDIELTDDSRFPQFSIQADDIKRIKEQIRVWKPINVVFRDIIVRYVDEINLYPQIEGPVVSITEFGAAIGRNEDDEDDEVIEPEYIDPELTNCAF